jgi:S-DNA-T family DNA segregation ATPase FtsK/SpoIIIE
VDFAEAWIKIGDGTKSAGRVSATATVNALDAVSPVCAPFAARWDAEADRRQQLRTPEHLKALMNAQRAHNSARSTAAQAKSQRRLARRMSKNPLGAARRAARTADKASQQQASSAKTDLKAARRDYPATLRARAIQAHIAQSIAGGTASWLLTEQAHTLTIWPGSVSAALIGANAAALWLGRRTVTAALDDDLSAEERRLASRLDPSFWVQNADDRGLAGTVTTPAEATPAGLVSHVRLDGRWTPRTFGGKADEIRALLGARTDLRMEIRPGSHGDRATITLRTRNAAEGADLTGWTPGCAWGIDTVTGEPVMVPLGRRMLIAGTSGSGKSWSTRALLAEASEAADQRLVVIDPKRVEAINWEHRARVAITRDDVLDVTDELVEEMHERLYLVPRGRDTIEISTSRPRITVFVDEGAEVISMSRDKAYRRVMENLGTLARMARAAEIILIWATQKPTMDAKGGIDPQISAQITYRAALALSTSSESRTVFGEDATEKGWHAHELPMPGVALLRSGPKATPHPIRTRAFSPADVIALPDRPVWQRDAAATVGAAPAERPGLRLVKAGPDYELAPPAPPEAAPATNRDRVLQAVREGSTSAKTVVEATGLNKGTVSREVKALVEAGALRRAGDGTLTVNVGEVSA